MAKMIKFYTNRELAQKLGINLARWKRWSREFLPPDPLGGLQSGFARQYNLKDGFWLYLGGFLVADLKYSIPDARQILKDLKKWFETKALITHQSINNHKASDIDARIARYEIKIMQTKQNGGSVFRYQIRGIILNTQDELETSPVRIEKYVQTTLGAAQQVSAEIFPSIIKMLDVSALMRHFQHCLKL